MEAPKTRLLNAINFAKLKDRVLDVSKMSPNTKGTRLVKYPSDYADNMKFFTIDNFPMVSTNYKNYKLATDILGEEYHYLADYYLIILEIKKGDREYKKEIAKTNYPALASNPEVMAEALKILGKDYKYLINYYDLAISIRDDDYEGVTLFLEEFDPRDNNDFAYRIAVQYDNQDYIDLIEEEIIKRDWLEQQALKNVLGTHSPYRELHRDIRKLR